MRPVLNECVTPVTCYWSLSLILRGEAELMLVFGVSTFYVFVNTRYGYAPEVLRLRSDQIVFTHNTSWSNLPKIYFHWSSYLIMIFLTVLNSFLQELQPPVRMLVPVWKALCVATDSKKAEV